MNARAHDGKQIGLHDPQYIIYLLIVTSAKWAILEHLVDFTHTHTRNIQFYLCF